MKYDIRISTKVKGKRNTETEVKYMIIFLNYYFNDALQLYVVMS